MRIFFIGYGFAPFVGSAFAGNFHSQMREPAVRCRTVPVFHFGRNIDHIAGAQFLYRLALFLIIAAARDADKNLSAAALGVMDVPVVAAAGFERHVENSDLACGDGMQVALSRKVGGKTVVGFADGEHTSLAMRNAAHALGQPA